MNGLANPETCELSRSAHFLIARSPEVFFVPGGICTPPASPLCAQRCVTRWRRRGGRGPVHLVNSFRAGQGGRTPW